MAPALFIIVTAKCESQGKNKLNLIQSCCHCTLLYAGCVQYMYMHVYLIVCILS